MPPARVERHVQRRIALARQRYDEIHGRGKIAEIHAEVRKLVVEPDFEHAPCALAYRPGAQ